MPLHHPAPGGPGIPARWTSSAKSGVGSSLSARSCVWFTLSHGILNEIYYPRIDIACVRDLGLLVTDGKSFFSEEKRHAKSLVRPVGDGVPAYALTNDCLEGRYRIGKLVLADPLRPVVLQKIEFEPRVGKLADYSLYALLAPHLNNSGAGNSGWIDSYKGVSMLFAERAGTTLALACSAPFLKRAVGYCGYSDGWQDLSRNFKLTEFYDSAFNGNVALTGEIDLAACEGRFTLALAFGGSPEEAGLRARASLSDGFEPALAEYTREWLEWQASLKPLDRPTDDGHDKYRVSAATLRCHEERSLAGGYIASLSIPWGFSKGDDDLGGYHLLWPRDLVEIAGGLLAAGAISAARRIVHYLAAIQEDDGHWAQNSWLDGSPYWSGLQLDETALPILLVDLARREGALEAADDDGLWPTVERAAAFILRNGPATGQDRWEEDGGYTPFTLAATIAALLAAADLAERVGEAEKAAVLRETADAWNEKIEQWLYVANGPLAEKAAVEGYYVRTVPQEDGDAGGTAQAEIVIKNRPPEEQRQRAASTVSPDALALVRFGLRAADDPRILNTVKVIDAVIRADFPVGPSWYRYNGDGYGEHADGSPFDGVGIGRPWPLLTGERAHYELEAGNRAGAAALLATFEAFANDGHFFPEQIWDSADLPQRELFRGQASGSAMPLAWAHAEHIKLLRSLADGAVFDMPPQPKRRYGRDHIQSRFSVWRIDYPGWTLRAGRVLRIELAGPAVVHWSADDWKTVADRATRDSGLGMHHADLPTGKLAIGEAVTFSILWSNSNRWEGRDFRLAVKP